MTWGYKRATPLPSDKSNSYEPVGTTHLLLPLRYATAPTLIRTSRHRSRRPGRRNDSADAHCSKSGQDGKTHPQDSSGYGDVRKCPVRIQVINFPVIIGVVISSP